MPIHQRIQHVSIPRPPGSEAATRAFYIDLLGLPEIAVPAALRDYDLIWFAVGDDELHVFATAEPTVNAGQHFCLIVDDLAAVRARLEAAQVETWDTVAIPGRPRFFCRDPFGNAIEIMTVDIVVPES